MTDFGGKTSIFSHPVYLFLRKFSLQDSRGGSETWWIEFDPAVDSEIRKTCPAVIVSNDAANRNLARVVVVPLTSNTERVYPSEGVVTVGVRAAKRL
ncbi:type II toxin-antitoxin system PemK/MazF family toxin [Escherichia coli]|nr:type II toxin-antitoxin system PemK/MazF family toxin [Escherichia coli]ELC4129693.1 type II toxin-antitoxin system PemK/MazF family toxin [Escherichia coli]ELM5370363.1 type II toxin-antitoxin system PemK/MazF family toxin [Escherichia coli]HCP9313563.1 type II toxin-antitoxin system PemK/MazF family toxin [Escherichia coli]